MRQTNGVQYTTTERTAVNPHVLQAVLLVPASLPLPSAGANLRRARPVTAYVSGAYLIY